MRFLKSRFLRYWARCRRFFVHNILHADDNPHKLALGIAIGIFWTFTPFIGAQMILVVATAWLLRANKIVGLPWVWISNPATFVPIFYPCYLIGRILLGRPEVDRQWWNGLASPPPGFIDTSKFYWDKVLELFAPLMLGCFAVALPLAVFSYLLSRTLIERYRARREI